MEWDPKIPPWDLEELEQTVESHMGSIVGSSGGHAVGSQSGVGCSVDLKLGGSGDFWPSEKWKDQPPKMLLASASMAAASSSSSPSKRARPPGNAGQNVSCLVDGCTSDLSNGRDYHRRHKVCEVHSKTAIVMVGGQEQRFCQQCSRFHLLREFDEVKRSCRKRLDGHNRRRRKPHPEPISSGSFFLNHQGSRFSTYPHMLPTPAPDASGFGIKEGEEDVIYSRQSHLNMINSQSQLPGSFSRSYRELKQYPFLQDGDTAFSRMNMEPSTCQPPLKTMSSAESSGCKIFSDGLPQVLDSDCALSLLSSPSQTSVISMSQLLPQERISIGQRSISSLQYGSLGAFSGSQPSTSVSTAGFSGSGVEDEQVGTVMVSDADHLHCQVIFQIGSEGSSHGTSQALPFSWQ